jgi:hypothetical protein
MVEDIIETKESRRGNRLPVHRATSGLKGSSSWRQGTLAPRGKRENIRHGVWRYQVAQNLISFAQKHNNR